MCNCKIILTGKHNELYAMTLPVLEDKLMNLDFDAFIGFCNTPVEEFSKKIGLKFKNKLSLFKFYKNNKSDLIPVLDKYFKKYMIGFHYVDDFLYWGNRVISAEIFETFCVYISIAAGVKSLEDTKNIITDDMDEFEKKRILMEQKIAKTKAKGREDVNIDLGKLLAGICKEFHFTFDQLKQMTLYSIYYMYSLMGTITAYEIGNIACGNGLMKENSKHNHWVYSGKS